MATYVQDVFLLFGDSITQKAWTPGLDGFGQRLTHFYANKLDVLNRGFSGYNTSWSIPIFEQCIEQHTQPDAPKLRALAIWFGANDSCIKPSPQHVPLETFAANLKRMVDLVKSPTSPRYSPSTRIILIGPPPINTFKRRAVLEARVPPEELDRDFEITRAYAEAVRSVALAEGVAFVDVWTALWDAAGKDERSLARFMDDGLHLNANGYAIMYEQLMTTIAKSYPDVHYDNVPYTFPFWNDIDWEHPEKSLRIGRE